MEMEIDGDKKYHDNKCTKQFDERGVIQISKEEWILQLNCPLSGLQLKTDVRIGFIER